MLLSVLTVGGMYAYKWLFTPVNLGGKNYSYLFVRNGATVSEIADDLYSQGIIKDEKSFLWLAEKMHLGEKIHPGRYRVINGMSIRQVINLIRYKKEEKVKLSITSQIYNPDVFVSYVSAKTSVEKGELKRFLNDRQWLEKNFGLSPESAFGLIVPGTYEVSWAVSAKEMMDAILVRYRKIWNRNRIAQARQIGYSPEEVIILASIVQSESSMREEQEKIAGVYINRLRKGMMLQADPTLRFANNAFDARRFWNSDKQTNSPYNTYRYKGLPPGPVCIVYPQAIDATLNYQRHRYMYFCAKPSLNGYSDFSETYSQHERYANAYRKAMNARGINR
jgi:UPF0755 protein